MSVASPPRILAGSARSGTTWLVDVLAQANGAGTVFEPLNPEAVPAARGLHNRYLAAGASDAEADAFFTRLFAGGWRGPWTLGRVYPRHLLPGPAHGLRAALRAQRTLLGNLWRYGRSPTGEWLYKLVRGNLMLDWLAERFDARIALVIRHPGAVVRSRLARGWPWRATLARYLADEALLAAHLGDVASILRAVNDDAAGHAAIWAVQHRVALRQWQRRPRFVVCFYESLVLGDDAEWGRLGRALGLSALPGAAARRAPSQQADPHLASGAWSDAAALGRWRGGLADAAIDAVARIVAACDLDELYAMDADRPAAGAARYRVDA